MSNAIVLIQHTAGVPSKMSLCALEAARQIQKSLGLAEISCVAFGDGADVAAKTMLDYGVSKSLYSSAPQLSKYLAAPVTAALLDAVTVAEASVVIAASSSTGKDLLPRIAAHLEAGQASDIVAVSPGGVMRRPMYAGDVFAEVEITTANKVITVRTSAFAPAEKTQSKGAALELTLKSPVAANSGEVVSYEFTKAERPQLSDAAVVVSGGRALQSAESFMKVIAPLADAFGGAIGASRAAVDSGYAPNDWQVGQTGKIVAPNLYVAVGISGAIQHLAGMKDSKVIVAINKDPEAPIFEVADYGLVADLYTAAPALTEAIKKAKGA